MGNNKLYVGGLPYAARIATERPVLGSRHRQIGARDHGDCSPDNHAASASMEMSTEEEAKVYQPSPP